MSNLAAYTENLIHQLSGLLQSFQQQGQHPELQPILARWEEQSARMRRYAAAHDHVSIAFVGGTGAGKSTLINALLEADLLPTHSFRTCTSAAIEVAHAARKTWRAELSYLPLEAWEAEKQAFLEEVQQARESGHSSFAYQDFLYKAWSLYRPRHGQPPMPFPFDELLKLLAEPLPQALHEQISAGRYELKARTPAELKAELSRFLTAESPVWPLIRQVYIEGPAPVLQDGLHLIDLPGLNDPNPVRERIAHHYLQQAEFIWLIFGTGRGLTREVVEVMKDQQFISQIVLDGKVSALSFIGTRSDDFVPELERQSLNLSGDSSLEQIRQAREILIRQQIQQQLSELTLWFGNRYKVSQQSQEVLDLIAATLQQSPIHLTSALNYLALSNWFSLDAARFTEPEQTGIPQAQAHMREIVAEHGIKARKKLIRSQFQQINREIRRLIEGIKYRRSLKAVNQQQLASLHYQIHKIRQDQLRSLRETREELQQELRLRQAQFEKQLLYAFTQLQGHSERLLAQWSELNWQYLARAVQNQGRYTSPSTGTQVDLMRDLLLMLESEVALDWYAFFQQRLIREMDRARSLLSGLLEQSARNLMGCFEAQTPQERQPQLRWQEHLLQLKNEGQGILEEAAFRTRHEAEDQIQTLQRQIPDLLQQSLEAHFQPVFNEAADYQGKGRKQHILERLEQALAQELPQLAQEIQAPLQSQLESLVAQISRHQEELAGYFLEGLDSLCQLPPNSSGLTNTVEKPQDEGDESGGSRK